MTDPTPKTVREPTDAEMAAVHAALTGPAPAYNGPTNSLDRYDLLARHIAQSLIAAAPQASLPPVEGVSDAIWRALRKYTLTNMDDGDGIGVGYPLVDLMSNDDTTIATGEAEMRVLADHLAGALEKAALFPVPSGSAPPAIAGSSGQTAQVLASSGDPR